MGTGSLSSSSTPVKVLALGQAATQVAAGDSFACARLADGSAACWGDDGIGQLGNGQIADYAIASPVKNLPDAVKVCAGSYHACAVRSGGQVVCWGSNWAGQLGDGTAMIVDTPTPVQSF
jgi:alpha-tubulin suppressor-like RCC1 family protein